MWSLDRLWPESCLVDVYCHPDFWDRASELLDALPFPEADRHLAYCDAGFEPKAAALSQAGFRASVTYGQRVACDRERTAFADVTVWRNERLHPAGSSRRGGDPSGRPSISFRYFE